MPIKHASHGRLLSGNLGMPGSDGERSILSLGLTDTPYSLEFGDHRRLAAQRHINQSPFGSEGTGEKEVTA